MAPAPQGPVTLPELSTGHIGAGADSDQLQRHAAVGQLIQPLLEGLLTPGLGVQLHRIGLQLPEQRWNGLRLQQVGALLDQPQGAGRQAAAAAIAALHQHASAAGCSNTDRQGRADPLTGPRALGRATAGIKPSLTEVGILTIAEAHHQPGTGGTTVRGPGDPASSCSHHSSVGRQVEAMDTCQGVDARQILDRRQVLIAGTTNPLHPAAGGERSPWR